MNTSPITTWEGAEAVFTLAGSSFGIGLTLVGSVVLVVAAIWYGIKHETRDFERIKSRL